MDRADAVAHLVDPSDPASGADEAQIIREARRLFALQREHRWTMARTTVAQRTERLDRLRRAILERRDALAEAVHRDFGKHPAEFDWTELEPTLLDLKEAIERLEHWLAPRPVATPLLFSGTHSHTRLEPRGQVLILAPWNYPFKLTIAPLVPALASGNCVMLRPSEKTPHMAEALRELVCSTFDEREVALVKGGVEVADALLELPFDHFFFTGSPQVGRKVMARAAAHLASVTLELGGKSPAIVHRSADVARAAERIVWGKFVNAGQTCIAPDHVLVDAAVERPFVEALGAAIARAYGADEEARRRSPDLCRLVDEGAFLRVNGLLQAAIAQGAKVEVGGVTDAQQRYISPTVLSCVPASSPIMTEEIFGPLLPVLTYQSLDEAIARVRQGDKPLALYVFARDEDAVEAVLAQTTAGGSLVNNTLLHIGNPHLPFGGVGASGQGSYHGEAGIRAFSHQRSVMRQGRPSVLKHVLYPPYTAGRRRLVRLIGRLFG
jgi:aldehyde dehydrogenase (NAD+)